MNFKQGVFVAGLVTVVMLLLSGVDVRADLPTSISEKQFARLHALIKPGAGESGWMVIDWYPSVWEARQKAAAEGKPLFIWAGSGGAPAAGC